MTTNIELSVKANGEETIIFSGGDRFINRCIINFFHRVFILIMFLCGYKIIKE
jgi:hypothetical protein